MTIGILVGIVCLGTVIGVLAAARRCTASVLVRTRPGRTPNQNRGNTY